MWKTLKQRRLLESVFILGLKNWGLGGPRDILPRDRYTAWGGENLQDRFWGVRGGGSGAIKSASSSHTQRKTRWRPVGAFSQTLIFFLHYFIHII